MTGARLGGKKYRSEARMIFFPANQPDRAALHSQWQRAIFAVRNEIMEYYVGLYFIIKHVLYALYQVRFLHCLRMWVLNVECRLVL